jgi:D-tagatose-1,6-bisphosphate aldolase subunit GatZ/KbaZ
LHAKAFAAAGAGEALGRVIALVVQPGVDMGNSQVFGYEPAKAAALSAAIHGLPGIVYEAHSTDFQTETALGELVAAHFPILKVGPALTFAFREAAFGLAEIERRLEIAAPSGLIESLERAMDADPRHWRPYIEKSPDERLMRLYGLSDRLRYYWPTLEVQAAFRRLVDNVDSRAVPVGLVSQCLGNMLMERPEPLLSKRAFAAKVGAVVGQYRRAAGA